jgi:hypothetical protein
MYEASVLIARFVNPMVSHEEALEASPLSDRLSEEDEADGDNGDVERDL